MKKSLNFQTSYRYAIQVSTIRPSFGELSSRQTLVMQDRNTLGRASRISGRFAASAFESADHPRYLRIISKRAVQQIA